MNRTTGILSLTAALYFWWLHSRRPQVHVLQTNAAARSVSYHMQVNGKEISDTYVLGDAPQFIPAGDGVHFFAAIGNTATKIVELAVGYFTPDGGFKSRKSTLISF